jgi:hypothetical protein
VAMRAWARLTPSKLPMCSTYALTKKGLEELILLAMLQSHGLSNISNKSPIPIEEKIDATNKIFRTLEKKEKIFKIHDILLSPIQRKKKKSHVY